MPSGRMIVPSDSGDDVDFASVCVMGRDDFVVYVSTDDRKKGCASTLKSGSPVLRDLLNPDFPLGHEMLL